MNYYFRSFMCSHGDYSTSGMSWIGDEEDVRCSFVQTRDMSTDISLIQSIGNSPLPRSYFHQFVFMSEIE